MRYFINILFWLLITAYLVIAIGFTAESRKGVICNELHVIVEDSLQRRFYNKGDLEEIILGSGIETLGYPVSGINTRKLEQLYHSEPYIRKVDIYTTMNGILSVRVKQREPIVRVLTPDGRSCYLDREGFVMPENRKYARHLLVTTGNFPGFSQVLTAGNLESLENKTNQQIWSGLLKLANLLYDDPFWRNQIVQVYRARQGHFELIPRVGAHQIILGDVNGLEEKMENLRILYNEGLAYEGWNNYDRIDLRYNNQVVCTKR